MAEEFKKTPLIEKLNTECSVALEFQKRKHEHWKDNYTLYRDFVEVNRLTQRQAINFPIMKETIGTLLSGIDDPPSIYFKCLEEGDAGKEKEIVINEVWDYDYGRLNLEGLDVLDKKNVLLCGRSFKKLNFLNGEFYTEVLDNHDVLVDPKTNPLNLETARWVIHQHIFKTLRDILANPKYTAEGKQKLKEYLDTKEGILKSADTEETLEAKQERLKLLGVENFEEFGASDVICELKEHYTYIWNEKEKKFVRHIVIYAMDSVELFNKPLKEVLGVEFYPFVTWGDDIDISDFWSDGKADLVRVPNKILNIWLSQLLENRTLRNYSMFWYNSLITGFIPQTYEPKPFGMYPSPGDPNQLIKQITIPDLSGTIEEMAFIRNIVERATSTPVVEKGISEPGQQTKGEVFLLATKATKGKSVIVKAYQRSWKEYAEKWFAIIDANTLTTSSLKLYKESFSGKVFEKEVKAKDWKSKAGYKVKVLSTSEQEEEKTIAIQKWTIIKNQYPDNLALQKIANRRIWEILGLTPDEIKEAMAFEEQKMKMPLPQPQLTPTGLGTPA